ncbi:MAG: UDP-N-acetylmuramoyl-tripeptide--D-alanyl-D-alanine ligase, partial [Candidatus Cloacimonetes bacterium]|nr:UDP-N-acetylmuramoyl-tripeptide--D-alanyl-D-alanine ligase [Candidatus Cloacimonadota bacterium]
DRKPDIRASIRLAQTGDMVVICGKGHENYQEIEGVRYPFDDFEVAKQALSTWKLASEKSEDELVLPVDITMLELLCQIEKQDYTDGYKPPKHFSYISTDSRQIKKGSLFFAIVGERYDGHSYIPEVLANAENFVVCEKAPSLAVSSSSYYTVENSVTSLGMLCQKYLQMFAPQKIAITGSTGKTTSKELIAQVLNDHLPCLKTRYNENNLIGLCKTILRVIPAHKYAVFELGTNHFGEIAILADIACPDIAIVLNIGPSHLEFLKDEDGVYLEKSSLFKRPLALRLYPGDDHRFKGFKSEGASIGYSEDCDYQVSGQSLLSDSQSFLLAGFTWQLPYPASHYAINAAFAIVLALKLGLTKEEIQASLLKPINIDMRLQLFPRGKGTVIVDCYNANPCSMQKALEYWQQVHPEYPHIAILGDMLELGENTAMYHQMIGAMLAEMKVSELYTVGEFAKLYHDSSDMVPMNFATVEDLKDSEKLNNLAEDTVILVKASHGMHLERLLSTIQGGL